MPYALPTDARSCGCRWHHRYTCCSCRHRNERRALNPKPRQKGTNTPFFFLGGGGGGGGGVGGGGGQVPKLCPFTLAQPALVRIVLGKNIRYISKYIYVYIHTHTYICTYNSRTSAFAFRGFGIVQARHAERANCH